MLTGALGFSLAILMGLTLGLIGTGGSMMSVPIMVYLFHVTPVAATGYSLLVVGSTALVGAFSYWQKGMIRIKNTFIFVIPSTIMILLTRRYILPQMPDPILTLGQLDVSKDSFIMVMFAFLMLMAGMMALKPIRVNDKAKQNPSKHLIKLILGSGAVGFFAGLVGAGGGFLIIPVLLTLFQLSMHEAVGTSLAIIMVNSLIGFQGDLVAGIEINWRILGPFLMFAVLGMLLGIKTSEHVDNTRLKQYFAYFMLGLAGFILLEELFQGAIG